MRILDCINQKISIGKHKRAIDYVNRELHPFHDWRNYIASYFYDWWFDPTKGKTIVIGKILLDDTGVKLNHGFRKMETFYVASARSYYIKDYIKEKYNFIVRHTSNSHRMEYTKEKFFDISRVAIAMVISKYETETLSKGHLFFELAMVMFRFFRVYDDSLQWLVNPDDIMECLTAILQEEIENYYEIAKEHKFFAQPDVLQADKRELFQTKPQCVEDLTECFTEGMTQTEKRHAIMENWDCSERTAFRLMAKYGLTEQKYTRNDYKEIHEHIEEVTDDIFEKIDKGNDSLHSHLSYVENMLLESNMNVEDILKKNERIEEMLNNFIVKQN